MASTATGKTASRTLRFWLLPLAAAWFLAALAGSWMTLVSGKLTLPWLTVLYLTASCLASIAAFSFYALDKLRAKTGGWRVPELTLHLCALAGGWSGALVGQQVFRHKTRKLAFQVIFWTITALHGILITWGLARLATRNLW